MSYIDFLNALDARPVDLTEVRRQIDMQPDAPIIKPDAPIIKPEVSLGPLEFVDKRTLNRKISRDMR